MFGQIRRGMFQHQGRTRAPFQSLPRSLPPGLRQIRAHQRALVMRSPPTLTLPRSAPHSAPCMGSLRTCRSFCICVRILRTRCTPKDVCADGATARVAPDTRAGTINLTRGYRRLTRVGDLARIFFPRSSASLWQRSWRQRRRWKTHRAGSGRRLSGCGLPAVLIVPCFSAASSPRQQ